MAAGHQVDKSWMWHPSISEERVDTAGLFVHFRRSLIVDSISELSQSLKIHITADTRYKLFVNGRLVTFGPVKGDPALWFYDEVDVAPFLKQGANKVLVVVLRFFHGTQYATSFPRLPVGGLRIVALGTGDVTEELNSSTSWETAIDPFTILRVDEPEDDFLHVYEKVNRTESQGWLWVGARLHEFQTSTGNAPPWKLSPRLIPQAHRETTTFSDIHNLHSTIDKPSWSSQLLQNTTRTLTLAAGSEHHFDLEMAHHTTGLIKYCFKRAGAEGSVLKVTYSESYEDRPSLVPYLRVKSDRRDTNKSLYGPSDTYHFEGSSRGNDEDEDEVYAPFHWRTFRFIHVSIVVGLTDLVLRRFEVETVNYPLDVKAKLVSSQPDEDLWTTSIRTLKNCMHDCYEDCPFYEQLQYAMDTRSSVLFTYRLSGDDRLARQAIIQLHNSFQPYIGLTSSRAPSHKCQIIPHFSLFWICMLNDHFDHFGDTYFLGHFVPAVDAVLGYFKAHIGELDLVMSDSIPGIWNFTDWAKEWRPYGIPPLAERTGISTYTNHLYAYTLRQAASILAALDRREVAQEYLGRADKIVHALRQHCFDGQFFADSLASAADKATDYSQQNQAWAVLSGAIHGTEAQHLMHASLNSTGSHTLVPMSISMSFYMLRALSLAGGTVYDDHFHQFWAPWHAQLALNVTTWEEDGVSQRSDCHAWGCAPIYEFMAEVAGIRPAGPGWSAICFQPRISLYRNFKASCPLRMPNRDVVGVAHVHWETGESGDIQVSLRFELTTPRIIPVLVNVSKTESHLMDTMNDISLIIRMEEIVESTSPSWEVIKPGDVERADMSVSDNSLS